ncbi:MAG: TIR domain-containing protein, partial [Bacteroidales bacterium]|nr:TIR domain-containing protein [Bacteroidales bacterium]
METNEEKIQTSEEKKYFAFISYSHKDKDAAKKLQNFIQGYKIPAKLEDRPDLPKRIGRVFRDEDELAGDELTPQIEEALRNSRYLIVVCSPNSAKSKYVNEEIEYFKSLGGETKILPYIIAGKATTDEDPECCYAPALKENQKKYQIVGGDAQENGAEAASVKLIAGMLRLEFNTLYDRFRKAEKRKRKIVITAITAFALLMACVTAWILFLYGGLDKAMNDLNKAYEDLKSEKAKVEIEKKAKDKAYEELDLTYKDLFATKDTLAIKNLALQSTNRELNLANLSLKESKSIILAENAMNKIEKGDYFGARRTALEAITLSYSPEAERALRQSWESNSGIFEGHSYFVNSVSWSPDGRYLASGSWNKTVIIWDANSGEKLKTLEGNSGYVYSVSWSPDGKYLASDSDDNTVIIWDVKNGEKLKSLKGHSDGVLSVSWSPDGKYLASGSFDRTIKIWDANSGQELKTLEGHSNDVNSVSWSPDGKYLASGSQRWNGDILIGCIEIWDAKSGEKLKTLEGHYKSVGSVSWSPDGKYLASDSDDYTLIIWDANSGQ